MCRRKPGRRCPRHSSTRLQAARRRLDAAQDNLQAVRDTSGPDTVRRHRAEERMRSARRNWARARMDYDATGRGAQELRDAIARPGLSLDEVDGLRTRIQRAADLSEARARQSALMPDVAVRDSAKSRFAALGAAREELAYLAVEGEKAPGAARRLTAAERNAFNAEVAFRVENAGGAYDRAHLLSEEIGAFPGLTPPDRRELVALSHMRAAAASGSYPDDLDDVVERQEKQLHRRLFTTRTRPGGYRIDKPARRARRRNALSSFLSGARRRTDPASLLWRELTQVTPGAQIGKQILPETG